MGKNWFIPYDPSLAKEHFGSDVVTAIYYMRMLRYDQILDKDSSGFFTVRSGSIEASTCISRRQQERARKYLESNCYLSTILRVPEGKTSPQVHYRIDKKLI